MTQLAKRITELSESATLAMTQKSRELKAKGIDIINLSIGEPDFNTPDFIKDAAKTAVDNNYSHYTPVPGLQSLKEAICIKLKRDNNLSYTPDEIVVSTGAKQSLMNVVMALVNPGDELLLPTPYWVSYYAMGEMAQASIKAIPTDIHCDFKLTKEQLTAAITDKSKLLIFSSPCNPSGSVYSKDELRDLAEVIKANPQLMVVSDEIYELINYSSQHESLAQFDEIKDQVITVNGVSKGFAMTGWRIGYIAAPKWLAQGATKMQGQFTSGANAVAQKAAEAALLENPAEVNYMLDAFKTRRAFTVEAMQAIDGVHCNMPEGAFYVFPDVSRFFGKSFKAWTINNATDLAEFLLMEAHVALVTGEAFGNPDCIRISYATDMDTLKISVDRIKEALNKLS